ncbi:MAG: hypothetical protein ACXWVC_01445, partial [Rhodoplanes sp.]
MRNTTAMSVMPAAPVRAAFACLSRHAAVRMQVIRLPKSGWAVSLRVTEQIRVIDVIVELPGDRTARTTGFTDILPMRRSGRTILERAQPPLSICGCVGGVDGCGGGGGG